MFLVYATDVTGNCFFLFDRPSDIKEIEKTALNLLHVENTDIKQKHDPARCVVI